MVSGKKRRSELTAVPMLPNESLYIGVDIGKFKHVAGFLSKTLLERHKHFEHCPAFIFEQSREGYRAFVERIQAYGPLEQCFILMEQTGHYHRPLLQYLVELDLPVFVIPIQRRQTGMIKTDKRDALGLANQLYTQLELGAQVADTLQVIRRALPPSEAAAQLKGLMRHRYELVNEATQRKNKLIAMCDELFPEFTRVFKDPNAPIALGLREQFPTPRAIATIGSIGNFEGAAHLKSYFGWAPTRAQTGVSFDRTRLTKGGSREMKKVMFLVAWKAIQTDTEWAKLYKCLVPRLCSYDDRMQAYKGKGKVLGHSIGRLIVLIFALLKKDYEVLSQLSPGTEPPAPTLYDPQLHHRHRTGYYSPFPREGAKNRIVQVSQ